MPEEISVNEILNDAGNFFTAQNWPAALELYSTFLEQYPHDEKVIIKISDCLEKMGELKEAELSLSRALDAMTDKAEIHVAYASIAMRQKKYKDAAERWDQLRINCPDHPFGYSHAGWSWALAGERSRGESLCRMGADKFPSSHFAWLFLAQIADREGNLEECENRLEQVLFRFSDRSDVQITAITFYLKANLLNKAVAQCNDALSRFPLELEIRLLRLKILAASKDSTGFQTYAHSLLTDFPNNSRVLSAISESLPENAKNSGGFIDIILNASGLKTDLDALNVFCLPIFSYKQASAYLNKQLFNDQIKKLLSKHFAIKAQVHTKISQHIFNIISLGYRCWMATFIQRWALNINSSETYKLPFDLAISPSKSVITILDNNFCDFDKYEYLDVIKKQISGGGDTYIFKNKLTAMIFNHDHLGEYGDAIQFSSELKRRVVAFKNNTLPTLFLHELDETPDSINLIGRFCKYFTSQSKNYLLLIDNSDKPLEQISRNVYKIGLSQKYIFANVLAIPLNELGTEYECILAKSILQIIENNFPKRQYDLGNNETINIIQNQYYSQIAQNPQLSHFIKVVSNVINSSANNGAIVMNCNPFTNGHLFLIEYASQKVDNLLIFIVEEDKSYFSFNDRISLARKCSSHLPNVHIFPSGSFIISTTTFPQYFIKDNREVAQIDATKDLFIFGKYIAPALGIKIRFVGSEPNCHVTRSYNNQMKSILTNFGIDVHEASRKELDGIPISASMVRQFLKNGNLAALKPLVPNDVYEFLSNNIHELSSI